jgi:ABC-type Na+ transport system ATPase subunit NatA
VDLKQPGAAEVVLRLLEGADGLIEGFRPGVMERLGLGPDVCLARNPRLAYGRLTGWGQDGPLAYAPGHDLNYIALAGALNAFGLPGQPPVPPLNLLGDFGGGGMLLGQKISSRVAKMRTLPEGIDQRSACRHPDWTGPDDLAIKIQERRELTDWMLANRHRFARVSVLLSLGIVAMGVTVANLDYPTAANSYTMPVSGIGRHAYLRLHGRNRAAWFDPEAGRDETYNYLYSAPELQGLADRAREPVHRYSGGMLRRLNLAAGLVHNPKVLLLDEPTVGIDPQSRVRVLEIVRERAAAGVAVLYTSHYMEEAEQLCHRFAIIDHGRVLSEGTLDELLAKAGEVIRRESVPEPSLERLFLHLTGREMRE